MSDLNNLPFGSEYNPPERIVCAATKFGEYILSGVRHGCKTMNQTLSVLGSVHICPDEWGEQEQGFLTSKHRFVDRYEAWGIAADQNQIVRRVGGDTKNGGRLFSENLY